MIKESKYIIRRIIIGVGIALTLTFLNGCEVKAMTLFDGNVIPDPPSVVVNNDYPYYVSAFSSYSATQYDFNLIYQTTNNLVINNTNPNPWVNGYVYYIRCPYHYDSGHIVVEDCSNSSWKYNGTIAQGYGVWYWTNQNIINSLNHVSGVSGTYSSTYYNRDILFQNGTVASSFAELSPYLPITIPEFVSFNSIPITTNNVITSYTVQPEFSLFDTDNYVYQYSFDNNGWLSLTENEQTIRINGNSTIYVRIKDKNNNDIIDSVSFTITNIGNFLEPQTYDINFSGEYRTTNNLSDNTTSNSSSIISEYQIYVDYLPKSSILTYQYQYVNDGDSLDNNSWQSLSSSDDGSFTYVASDNGVLYARILDREDNVLKTGTFTVNSIGKLALDNENSKFNNFYTSLRDKIDFGGPIGSLINIPITLLQTISDGFNGMTGVCSNYNLGDLFGYNLHLPCVNVREYLGDTLYNTIDIIISCVMIYHIFKMLSTAYYQFLLLESTPISEEMSSDVGVPFRRC